MSVFRRGRIYSGAERLPALKGHDIYGDKWASPYGTYRIYAYLDATRRVLYVGRTVDVQSRNQAHHQGSDWYPHATEFRVLWSTPDRAEAVAAEAKAIRALSPLFNIQHNRRAA